MTAEIIHSSPPLSNNNNNNNDSNPNLQELRTKLAALQHRRHLLQTTRREQEALYARLQDHHHNLQHHQHLLQLKVVEWTVRHRTALKLRKQCPQWNALGDAFFIWHQGPFGTINGIRLGAEAVVTVRNTATTTSNSNEEVSSSTGGVATAALGVMAATVSLPGRYLGFSSSSAAEQPVSESANNNNNNNNTTNIPPSMPSTTTMTVRVPWTEINSALGQIVLLLHHLEQQPHSGIQFPRHTLIPQGSTSKIGLRQPNAITGWRSSGSGEIPIVAMYHLYSDDSFALFGKRNFNLALRALVECCAICANAMYARDRTMVMPFKMQVEHDNPSALCTIGGLSVQYNNNNTMAGGGGGGGDDNHPGLLAWTRVMKYLLTNVKWCVGFAAKHVDQ